MNRGIAHFVALSAAAALTASCAERRREIAAVPLPVLAPPSAVPATPGVLPINRGLTPGETLWHVRAALNVAALACTTPAHAAVAANYNAMLRRHDAVLTQAYREEEGRYRQQFGARWQDEFDRHQTALYNNFADPRATQALCVQALALSGEINALDPAQLSGFAARALAGLEAPVARAKAQGITMMAPPPVPATVPGGVDRPYRP